MPLSEESRLLISNWDAYQDIEKAGLRLRTEFTGILLSLKTRLQSLSWWKEAWRFSQFDARQVYIWHEDWAPKGTSLIWIGVEGFSPERLFGDDTPPQLYVWVSNKQANALIKELRSSFLDQGTAGHGQVEERTGNCYIIRKELPKSLPEAIDDFESQALESICTFMGFYASKQEVFSGAVAKQ